MFKFYYQKTQGISYDSNTNYGGGRKSILVRLF